MKRLILSLLLIVVLSSFVMASSEISVDFTRDSEDANVEEYIPRGSVWSNYGDYIVGVLVVLVVVLIMLKVKSKKKVKKVPRKKPKRVGKRAKKVRKK